MGNELEQLRRERDEALALADGLRGALASALEATNGCEIDASKYNDCNVQQLNTAYVELFTRVYGAIAIAVTGPDALDRVRRAAAAAELRRMAGYLRRVAGDVKEEGHHQYDLHSGLLSAADDCESRADELEAQR